MVQIPLKISYGSEQLPLKLGAAYIPCFILENGKQVFAKNDLHRLLGYDGKSDDWLLDLLGSINKFYPVPGSVFNALEEPLLFEIPKKDGSTTIAKGIRAGLLLEICKTITDAKSNGYISVSQLKFAKMAETVLKNISGLDLEQAINEASGFVFYKERAKQHLQQFFQNNTPEKSFQWTATLPDAFFEALFGLYQTDWVNTIGRPKTMAKLLHELVFSRIDDVLLEELRSTGPKRVYRNKKGILNDIQHPGLKNYTTGLLSLLETAAGDHAIFLQLLNRSFPIRNELVRPGIFTENSDFEEPVSELEKHLIKGVMLNRIYHKNK